MDVNEDTLELLERRLSERVANRVRTRMFWIYGVIGSGVLGGFAFLGVNFISHLEESALNAAAKRAESIVADQVGPVVESAKEATELAETQAIRAQAQLELMAKSTARREAEIEEALSRLRPAVEKMNVRLDQIQSDIDAAIAKADQQFQRNEDRFAYAGNFAELSKSVADLADQLRSLDADMEGLRASQALPLPDAGYQDSPAQIAIGKVIATADAYSPQLIAPETSNTVFVQYAGSQSGLVSRISASLSKQFGYVVPGQERVDFAKGMAEVRYFFESDASAAKQLAEDVNGILAHNEVRPNVRPNSYVDFKGPKPKPGVLELWLDPKPR